MGLNISIYDMANGRELPEWDCLRHAGDRELAVMVAEADCEIVTKGDPFDAEMYYRPKDIDAVVAKMIESREYNHDRWRLAGELLKGNSNAYFYFGY